MAPVKKEQQQLKNPKSRHKNYIYNITGNEYTITDTCGKANACKTQAGIRQK
jgi:hypothetical protein